MKQSESIKLILPALLKAQQATTFAPKDAKNTFFNNAKYATLESVIDAVKKPLNDNGIFINHSTSTDNILTTSLIHAESSEFVSSETKLLMNKQDMQSLGSASTYAKRYNLTALMNLPTDDDDGNLASKQEPTPVKFEIKKENKPVINEAEKQDNNLVIQAFAKSLDLDNMKLKELTVYKFGKPVDFNTMTKDQCREFCQYLKYKKEGGE